MTLEMETLHKDEVTGSLTAEASTLGFPVGKWPLTLEVAGSRYELAPRSRTRPSDVMVYQAQGQPDIVVFND